MNNLELKDYFAGQALIGLINSKSTLQVEYLVKMSYGIAEKMLEQKQSLINSHNIHSSQQIKLDNVENL